MRVTVPFGCSGELILPAAPGSVFEEKDNPLFAQVRDGRCLLEAGEYEISYEMAPEPEAEKA